MQATSFGGVHEYRRDSCKAKALSSLDSQSADGVTALLRVAMSRFYDDVKTMLRFDPVSCETR